MEVAKPCGLRVAVFEHARHGENERPTMPAQKPEASAALSCGTKHTQFPEHSPPRCRAGASGRRANSAGGSHLPQLGTTRERRRTRVFSAPMSGRARPQPSNSRFFACCSIFFSSALISRASCFSLIDS